MKSRYSALRTIGTLSIILAWVILILGILAAIGSWLGLRNLLSAMNIQAGGVALGGAVPLLLLAILGFLQWWVLGKVLQLLVGLDDAALNISQRIEQPTPTAQSGLEISGELKRQAQLIAANLETTQEIQQHIVSLEGKLEGPAPETTSLPPPEAVAVSQEGSPEAADRPASTVEEGDGDQDKAPADTADAVG